MDGGNGQTGTNLKDSKGLLIVAIVLLIFIGGAAGLIAWLVVRDQNTSSRRIPQPSDMLRVDCIPEAMGGVVKANRATCEQRGCAYNPVNTGSDIKIPPCFIPFDSEYGYQVVSPRQMETSLGFKYMLRRKSKPGIYGGDIESLVMETEFLGDSVLRIKFDDASSSERYKVPMDLVGNLGTEKAANPSYEVEVYNEETFSFRVIRKSTRTVIWDSGVGGFTFSDQFLQISTKLPSMNVYGFGENHHKSFKHDMNFKTWPMFSRDQPPGDGNENLYSVHPFYECIEDDKGHAHGVLLLNSNAMDYTMTPAPMLTYRTIGGILDFYVFMGPTPEAVIQQYTKAIGHPFMPPYWALGFQLSRYGYNNLTNMQAAVHRTISEDIPLDVVYGDIDHFYKNRDFTIDPDRFAGLPDYFRKINSMGIKSVIILDPTFEVNATYTPYMAGKASDIYIKWHNDSTKPEPGENDIHLQPENDMWGVVWPEDRVVFPDFFLNRTQMLWKELIHNHSKTIPFAGLWIDMNEPANFDTNKEGRVWNWPEGKAPFSLKCPENSLDDPPYRTMAAFMYDDPKTEEKQRLSMKTICMQARQKDQEYFHYDVHSLYGWSQTPSTLEAVREVNGGARSLVITRSTYPGSGHYAGRWLGDNTARWRDLKLSIIGMLEHNLFGIPYIGADICGFFGNTTPELCKRWQQLGAFYPYSRNHNHKDPYDQDPGALGEEVATAARDAIRTRYFLLPYLYTLFHKTHTHGGTVVRPLAHEFYMDKDTFDIDEQFLWGPALLISPILREGQDSIEMYFPPSRWYDYYSKTVESENGREKKKKAVDSNTAIPLHIRGGYIIPAQDYANNTQYSRLMPFTLLVALDANGKAKGELFWDDGETVDTYKNGNYYFARMMMEKNVLRFRVDQPDTSMDGLVLNTVVIMGFPASHTYIYLNGSSEAYHDSTISNQVLSIKNLGHMMNYDLMIEMRTSPKPMKEDLERIDCWPQGETTKSDCEGKGCMWHVSPSEGVPSCYLPSIYGYELDGEGGSAGDKLYMLKRRENSPSMFKDDFQNITLRVKTVNNNVLQLKITEFYNSTARYEVPVPLNDITNDTSNPVFQFENTTTEGGSFAFRVNRNSSGTSVFDTTIGGLTFSNQFLQLVTRVPNTYVYGIGEHKKDKFRHTFDYRTYPLWARDQGPGADFGNLYSAHPFFLCVEDETGKSFGVLLFNSNAMEITLMPTPAISYRTIGGVLDFYIIFGDNPEHVIQQYTSLIGHPYFPSYWALGFQISRYGYDNLANMQNAVKRTLDAEIPLDVFYGDIDYFHKQRDFTWDRDRFGGLPEYVSQMRSKGMKFITILDPFMDSNVTEYYYRPFHDGVAMDVYIKWPDKNHEQTELNRNFNNSLLGNIWPPGPSAFPDYFHDNATVYWQTLIEDFYLNITFDGLWIDMNEPANFDTDNPRPWNCPSDRPVCFTLNCPKNEWDDPPYKPRAVWGARLSDKTICMSAKQKNGVYRHYDVHNLYGWSQMEPTLKATRAATQERSIVISRSTFVGSGKYGGRWLGDNTSIWPHVKDSIVGMLDFNLFGIPYIGADICGYFTNTEPQLCQRWQQLGAFYPFCRNHNGRDNVDQDPAAFGPEVALSTQKIMRIRYDLLPYLYTLFWQVNQNGGTVVKALFFGFPSDLTARDIDDQFLWGEALLVTPVVTEDTTSVVGYFPQARWFDYYTGEEIDATLGGRFVQLDAPMDHIPIHIRGGHIIPIQGYANMTEFSRRNPFGLHVAPDSSGSAEGMMFWDDGKEIDSTSNNTYWLYTFSLTNGNLTIKVQKMSDQVPNMSELQLNWAKVYGIEVKPTQVYINGTLETGANIMYSPTYKMMKLETLNVNMNEEGVYQIMWS